MTRPLRIAQLTDMHIGFDIANAHEANLVRLQSALARLDQDGLRPDVLLLTGDLTEHGDGSSYRRLTDALAHCPVPVWPIPGNHDNRAELLRAFPQIAAEDGFIQYVIDLPGFRIVMLDTLEPGRHGGAFCDVRARWLSTVLAQAPLVPTLIAMHHPPFVTGIEWMDLHPDESWAVRFSEAIAGHGQIVGIICGHVHCDVVTTWHAIPAMVCRSTAPAVAVNLDPIDCDRPDGRAMITDEVPGLALHCWTGTALVSHSLTASPATVMARHDGQMTPLLHANLAERQAGV